jgi:5-formyltetrahydrofolate cyclo-ligase
VIDVTNGMLHDQKSALRERMHAVRAVIVPEERAKLAQVVAHRIAAEAALIGAGDTVSSYRAMGSEMDPEPVEDGLRAGGHTIVLPVTPPKGQPLEFHRFDPGDRLVLHRYGMREPDPVRPRLRPDVLLVPLLAFDSCGNRLGYGGGYYDRTLGVLRQEGTCVAIGLAFSNQLVDAVPHDAYDQRLDAVVTPDGTFRFRNSDV